MSRRHESREPTLDFDAFHGSLGPMLPITPAPRRRLWMDATVERWANRCLPLLIANESGWVLANPIGFHAVWTGDQTAAATTIEFDSEHVPVPPPVESHFGYGVITWSVPYLFRTPPGYNLLVRGPSNWPRHGISALEGVIETDWSVASFTMNWNSHAPAPS